MKGVELAAIPETLRQKITEQLTLMGEEDQQARKSPPNTEILNDIDTRHAETMWEILNRLEEWPNLQDFGDTATLAAFLVVQHTPDRSLQKKALKLMEAAVDAGQAMPDLYALLVDRDRTLDDLPQIYGSQLRKINGKLELFPILSPEKVNERRAKVQLPPIEDYLAQFDQTIQIPPQSLIKEKQAKP